MTYSPIVHFFLLHKFLYFSVLFSSMFIVYTIQIININIKNKNIWHYYPAEVRVPFILEYHVWQSRGPCKYEKLCSRLDTKERINQENVINIRCVKVEDHKVLIDRKDIKKDGKSILRLKFK